MGRRLVEAAKACRTRRTRGETGRWRFFWADLVEVDFVPDFVELDFDEVDFLVVDLPALLLAVLVVADDLGWVADFDLVDEVCAEDDDPEDDDPEDDDDCGEADCAADVGGNPNCERKYVVAKNQSAKRRTEILPTS